MKCNCWSIYKTGNDLLYPCYIISVFSRFPANLYIQEWILILYWKKLRFTWCSNVLGRATSSRLRSCKSQAPSVTGRTWPLLVFEQENALRSECIPVIVPNSGAEISLWLSQCLKVEKQTLSEWTGPMSSEENLGQVSANCGKWTKVTAEWLGCWVLSWIICDHHPQKLVIKGHQIWMIATCLAEARIGSKRIAT